MCAVTFVVVWAEAFLLPFFGISFWGNFNEAAYAHAVIPYAYSKRRLNGTSRSKWLITRFNKWLQSIRESVLSRFQCERTALDVYSNRVKPTACYWFNEWAGSLKLNCGFGFCLHIDTVRGAHIVHTKLYFDICHFLASNAVKLHFRTALLFLLPNANAPFCLACKFNGHLMPKVPFRSAVWLKIFCWLVANSDYTPFSVSSMKHWSSLESAEKSAFSFIRKLSV